MPLLLCYLEGRTQDEAAQQHGWSLSTLRRRLEQGRELLRTRMIRRGATLGAGLLTLALAPEAARAALPGELRRTILSVALSGGRGVAVSATVLALAASVRLFTLGKVLLLVALVLALGGILAGAQWQREPAHAPVAAAPLVHLPPAAAEPPPERVRESVLESLRRDLAVRQEEAENYPEQYWEARGNRLRQRVKELDSLAEMKSAFLFEEWRQAVTLSFARPAVTELAERLRRELKQEVDSGDAVRQLAAVEIMTELGARWESLRQHEKIALPPLLTLLARLTRDKEPAVCEAALVAAATDWTDGRAILDILKANLQEEPISVRIAAARALGDFVQAQRWRILRGRTAAWLNMPSPSDYRLALRTTIEVASHGLRAGDTEVHRGCWSAAAAATIAAADFLPEPFSPDFLPRLVPLGLKGPWDDELRQLGKDLQRDVAENQPMAQVLTRLAPAWERDLHTTGPQRLTAVQALREAARWRQRWLARLASFPEKAKVEDVLQPLLRRAEPDLRRVLKEEEIPARYAAIDTVEAMGLDFGSGLALQAVHDTDPFVREAAARVLGRRAPQEVGAIVPALAGMLADGSIDVRITALQALERYGAQARDKAVAVRKLAEEGSRRQRVQALRTLRALGPEVCRAAVPVLLAAAAPAEEPEMRVAAIAALGTAYPATAEVRAVLLRALRDTESAVRQAAAEALARR
jgi:HEAT repeat protein